MVRTQFLDRSLRKICKESISLKPNDTGASRRETAVCIKLGIANSIKIGGEAYLEVANDKDKAGYAPIIETGGVVYLSE